MANNTAINAPADGVRLCRADECPGPGAVINQLLSWGSAQGSVIFHLGNELGLPCPALGAAVEVGWGLCLGRRETPLLASGEPGGVGCAPRQLPAPHGAQPGSCRGGNEKGVLKSCRVTLGHSLPFSRLHHAALTKKEAEVEIRVDETGW